MPLDSLLRMRQAVQRDLRLVVLSSLSTKIVMPQVGSEQMSSTRLEAAGISLLVVRV